MKNSILFAAWLVHTAALGGDLAVAPGQRHASAHLTALDSGQVEGTVEFIQRGKSLQVLANLSGLTPGLHAFHLHQHGNCAGATAVGANYDPSGIGSGVRSEHHGGEFGAIQVDEQGHASLNMLVEGINLADEGTIGSVLGRSIVVHSSPDDFAAWPAPGKGKTLACGVIRAI